MSYDRRVSSALSDTEDKEPLLTVPRSLKRSKSQPLGKKLLEQKTEDLRKKFRTDVLNDENAIKLHESITTTANQTSSYKKRKKSGFIKLREQFREQFALSKFSQIFLDTNVVISFDNMVFDNLMKNNQYIAFIIYLFRRILQTILLILVFVTIFVLYALHKYGEYPNNLDTVGTATAFAIQDIIDSRDQYLSRYTASVLEPSYQLMEEYPNLKPKHPIIMIPGICRY